MRTTLGIVAALVLAGLGLALAGCATGQPGWENSVGTIEGSVAADPMQATEAAKKAVEELKLAGVAVKSTELDGAVNAMTANGEKVSITITKAGEKVSYVQVKVGDFGDEAVSMDIVRRMQAHLR